MATTTIQSNSSLIKNYNKGSFNYLKQRSPYYRVFVNNTALDDYPWLSKLIKSVEITESYAGGITSVSSVQATTSTDLAIITFLDAYDNVTYKSGKRVAAGINTGNPGNLMDLGLISNGNSTSIRVLTPQEVSANQNIVTPPANPTSILSSLPASITNIVATGTGTFILTLDTPAVNVVPNSPIYVPTPSGAISEVLFIYPDLTQIEVPSALGYPLGMASNSQPVVLQAKVVTPIKPKPKINTPKYLFQEDNVIDIEWGYNQVSPPLARRMKFKIQYVEYVATETDIPELKIYCVPTLISDLSKNWPQIGKNFTILSPTSSGNKTFHPHNAGEVIQIIANTVKAKYYISKTVGKLNYDTRVESEIIPVNTIGMSIYEFMTNLAKISSYNFFIGHDYLTDSPIIFFISNEDFVGYSNFDMTWKAPNSLLMSYTIRTDFSQYQDGTASAIDPNDPSQIQSYTQDESTVSMSVKGPEDATKNRIITPTSINISSALTGTYGDTFGTSVYVPSFQPNATKIALDPIVRKNEHATLINGTMIGHPYMSPCTINIDNIGLRYSGRYRLLTVKHLLDANAYKIEFTGMTNVIGDGLFNSNKPSGQPELSKDDSLGVQIKKPGQDTDSTGTSSTTPPSSQSTGVDLDPQDLAKNYGSTYQLPGKVKYSNGYGSQLSSSQLPSSSSNSVNDFYTGLGNTVK